MVNDFLRIFMVNQELITNFVPIKKNVSTANITFDAASNKMNEITFEVTEQNIKDGETRCAQYCPVSLALNQAHPGRGWRVGICFNNLTPMIYENFAHSPIYKGDDSLNKFVQDFEKLQNTFHSFSK